LGFPYIDLFQNLSVKLGTPFAVGGFQYWNTQKYWELGGYKEDELFAEDYSLSSKVKPKKFWIHESNGVFTSARRFKKKGIDYMFWIMIKSYLNRNNPEFLNITTTTGNEVSSNYSIRFTSWNKR
jgi:hypothetical protein